ncbi:MAG: GNAT family N-acetyltransferase, partial [Candidatus Limnocylindrales bacterium]
RYAHRLESLYETPQLPGAPERGESREEVDRIIAAVAKEDRTLLTEYESKKVLAAYGIPITDTELAQTPEEAIAAADEMGYPVVAKLLSRTVTHKTDVGGVVLNLQSAEAVREAFEKIRDAVTAKVGAQHFEGVTIQPMINWTGYELIVGSSPDPQFGPVLLFGMGGQLVEVFKDRALALPPLNMTLAKHLIDETVISKALAGVRGRQPIDRDVLAGLLVRFSELVAEQPRIAEIDINPLLASPERVIALDARVVLHPSSIADEDLPRLAIRPYPHEYLREATTDDGSHVVVRPIRPEDEPAVARFHARLSEETVRLRYGKDRSLEERTAHERLTRICYVDYDRQFALVAEAPAAEGGDVVGVARVSRVPASEDRLLTLVVADAWQRRGIGAQLVRSAVQVARGEKVAHLIAELSPDNLPMRELLASEGFSFEDRGGVLVAALATRQEVDATDNG